MPKLYSFGCSFSYGVHVPQDKCYPSLLASTLGYEHIQFAFPALCNDEIFSRFVSCIDKFEKGDLITYQFTFPVRKGFLVDYKNYESSAGFFNDIEVNKELMKQNIFANQSLVDLLLSNAEFAQMFLYHTVQRVVKLLNYLKDKREVNYRVLFISNEFTDIVNKMNSQKHTLRYDKPDYDVTERFFEPFTNQTVRMDEDNLGMINYVMKNKMTVSKSDNHPNVEGHKNIFDKIFKSL